MRYDRLILMAVAGVIIYVAFAVWSDAGRVAGAFGDFDWRLLPAVIGLVLAGYAIRAYRWDYYLRLLDIKLDRRSSYLLFLGGLSMSVTPGKAGELIKSVVMKERYGTPVSRSAPVVLVERITDLTGMLFIAAVGLLSFQYGMGALALFFVILVVMLAFLQDRGRSMRLVRWLGSKKAFKGVSGGMEEAYECTYKMLRPGPLLLGVVLSAAAWSMECVAFWLVLQGLGVDLGVVDAAFVFAFSSIIGIATLLPGGLGTTEGSMLGLLMLRGVGSAAGTAAVIIIRACTLWFAVGVGIVSLNALESLSSKKGAAVRPDSKTERGGLRGR